MSIFNGRVKARMSDDQPIILRLMKCPACGSFRVAAYGFLHSLSDGSVRADDDYTWWCLDCGHRRGDVLPGEQ